MGKTVKLTNPLAALLLTFPASSSSIHASSNMSTGDGSSARDLEWSATDPTINCDRQLKQDATFKKIHTALTQDVRVNVQICHIRVIRSGSLWNCTRVVRRKCTAQ